MTVELTMICNTSLLSAKDLDLYFESGLNLCQIFKFQIFTFLL